MKPNRVQSGVMAALLLGGAVFLLIIGKTLWSQPGKAVFYLVVAAIAAFIAKKIPWAMRKQVCRQCGQPMTIHDRPVYPGGKDEQGAKLLAIYERRFHCQQCNHRFFEIVTVGRKPEGYKLVDMTRSEWESKLEAAKKEAEARTTEAAKPVKQNWLW